MIKRLKKYENQFSSALSGSLKMSALEIRELVEEWKIFTGKPTFKLGSCAACRLKFVQRFARVYFQELNKIKVKPNGTKKTKRKEHQEG